MKESSSKQKQKRQLTSQYFCPTNKKALFCCSQPRCNNIAIKCISSNQCNVCKQNHKKCPRQIRIDKIREIAQQKAEKCPVNKIPPEIENLLKRLIQQLTNTSNQFNSYVLNVIRKWGLTEQLSSLLFLKDIKNKQSNMIANLIDEDPIFADERFYKPPQFKKDVDSVYKVNQKLRQRIFAYFQCYKLLAYCDREFKIIAKMNINNSLQTFIQKLFQIHGKFKTAIFDRLKLDKHFADAQQITDQKEIQDYLFIGRKLFNLTIQVMKKLYLQKKYQLFLDFYQLNRQLFSENRKQLRLVQDGQIIQILKQMQQSEAYCLFYTKKYQQAFSIFIKMSENRLNKKMLQTLIQLCEKLNKSTQTLLKYLLKLIQIERTKQSLKKILECYRIQRNNQLQYRYAKLLNQLLKQKLKQLSKQQLIEYFQRQIWILDYLRNKKQYLQENIALKEIINLIIQFSYHFSQLFQMELMLRYRLLVILRYQTKDYQNAAENSSNACQQYLNNKGQEKQQSKKISFAFANKVKQYLVKFLNIQVQGMKTKNRYQIIQKCVKICQQIRFKFFQPYYVLANLSFEYKKKQALQKQNRANQIYPTQKCYSNKAHLLYEIAMKQNVNRSKLNQCMQAIRTCIKLKPNNNIIYFLKGLVNHNLNKYRESNADFQKVIKYEQLRYIIDKKMGLNYQLIIKNQDLGLQQKQNMLKNAEKLYKNCLSKNQNDLMCLLGCARVVKLLKKIKQSEQYLNKIIELQKQQEGKLTEYLQQAYMILGNIKQQQGKDNDDRDFDKLQQALQLYLKAGKIRQNKQNVVRIYLQLDNQKKSKQIQNQDDWD